MTTPHCKWNHAIILMMNASKPLKCKTYPLTLKEQNAIDEILDEQLKKDNIQLSNSPYAS